jgi:acyl carrier protein
MGEGTWVSPHNRMDGFVMQEKVVTMLFNYYGLREAEVDRGSFPEKRLAEDLNSDSLDILEMAMEIEDTFTIEIPDETIAKWVTVQDVIYTVTELT